MINQWLDRVRGAWDDLNDRERRLVAALGVAAAVFILGFPLFWAMRGNAELEENNARLHSVLSLLAQKSASLKAMAEARRSADARYGHRTPPLGSFLEEEAKKHGLDIREITDQPEKTAGNYHRRSVRASINDVGLTGVVDLLTGIVQSPYPVAIDHIQIEHYHAGDSYRVRIGVLTFDKQPKATGAEARLSGAGFGSNGS
jgi:type II secretory pathway component PulM